MLKTLFLLAIIVGLAVAGLIGWYFFMKIRFKTVPSNEALIITGTNLGDPKKESNVFKDDNGRHMKVIRGGGHRLRMFQHATKVSLKSFQLHLRTPKVYTKQGVGVFGEAVATIKVADDLNGIVQYAEQFLGKKQKEIESEISEVLGSNLRAILSKMTVEEINSDREGFNEMVREIAQEQLDLMGFKITALGLTDLKDDEGYLENLGKPKVAEIQKKADIAESTNLRETKIHVAKMEQEVAEEQYKREMEVAESRKARDIKNAKILAETSREKAISEAAYQLEQEERKLNIEKKRLEIIQQDRERQLEIARLEKENEVKLAKEQVEIQRQQAEADYLTKIKESEALAESRRLEGEAEADIIRKKSQAEVEALEKRAEAMNKHKEVMLTEKVINMLPEYASAISNSLNNVESIRILDGGQGNQVGSLPQTITKLMTGTQEGLEQMTGINLEEMIKGFTDGLQVTDQAENIENIQTKTKGIADTIKNKNEKEFFEEVVKRAKKK